MSTQMTAQFVREHIIIPTLEHLAPEIKPSLGAEELLLGTAAAESRMGLWLRQMGGGPALSMFQIEPNTEADVWRNFLCYRPKLAELVNALRNGTPEELAWNQHYAAAIARIVYLRDPFPMPAAGNLVLQAQTWKRVYNTYLGKGTVEHYIKNWKELCV